MATIPEILQGRRRTIGEHSLDSKAIYELLKNAEIGTVISYAQMSEAIGRDVIMTSRGSVATARKMAMHYNGFVFAPVRSIGLKRLSNSEIADLPKETLVRIRRSVYRETKRQTVVDENQLSNQEKINRNSRMSLLGAIAEFTKNNTIKHIESHKPVDMLPVGRVLDLFR